MHKIGGELKINGYVTERGISETKEDVCGVSLSRPVNNGGIGGSIFRKLYVPLETKIEKNTRRSSAP